MKTLTIDEAQELRKRGLYLVTNLNMTKVIALCDSEEEAEKIKGKVKIWPPLIRGNWTKSDTENALRELSLGLQCSRAIYKTL